MAETRLDVENGKYTYIIDDEGHVSVLRHGKPWTSANNFYAVVGGTKALIALIHEHIELLDELAKTEEELNEVKCALEELRFGLGI